MPSLRLSLPAAALALLFLAAPTGCATSSAASAPTTATVASPDPAILAAVRALNDVCARRDLAGFLSLFDDSDDVLLVGSDVGEVFRGRAAIAGFMKKLFALPFVFSFDMPDPVVRQEGGSAWVFVDGAMVRTGASGKVSRVRYRITAVLVKRGDGWRWQVFSGSSPRAE